MAQNTTPEEWLKILQNPAVDDLKLAGYVLIDLVHYQVDGRFKNEDLAKLLALFTAIRLDQVGKDHA